MNRFNSTIKFRTGICIGFYCNGKQPETILANNSKKLCPSCNKYEKNKQKTTQSTPLYRAPIKKRSHKRAKEERVYSVVRVEYLEEYPICEVLDCCNKSNQIHHKKGRTGKLLVDKAFFMACCGVCHPDRIHNNVDWAKHHGYILSRTN